MVYEFLALIVKATGPQYSKFEVGTAQTTEYGFFTWVLTDGSSSNAVPKIRTYYLGLIH